MAKTQFLYLKTLQGEILGVKFEFQEHVDKVTLSLYSGKYTVCQFPSKLIKTFFLEFDSKGMQEYDLHKYLPSRNPIWAKLHIKITKFTK